MRMAQRSCALARTPGMFARSVDQAIVVFSQHLCIGLELALDDCGFVSWTAFATKVISI